MTFRSLRIGVAGGAIGGVIVMGGLMAGLAAQSPATGAATGPATGPAQSAAQNPAANNGSKLPPEATRTFSDPAGYAPNVTERATTSELRDLVARYGADRQMLQRFYTINESETRLTKLRAFHAGWLRDLPKVPFDTLSQEGQVDYVLLRNRIEYDRALLDRDARILKAVAPLVPFSADIVALQEARQRLEFISADAAASALESMLAKVKTAQAAADAGTVTTTPAVAIKAARHLDGVRAALREWFTFYEGYPSKGWPTISPR